MRVEDQIKDVLLGFHELAYSIKEWRAKDERERREREEQERRRKEWEAIQAANQKLIKQLETDTGAWHRARYLRRYVRAARRKLGERPLRARFRNETIDLLEWAEEYVNQLDPLNSAERTSEFEQGSSHDFRNDLDRMKDAFARLLGSDWTDAWKIGKDYSPPQQSEHRCYYGERSVFDIEARRSANDADG